MGARRCLCVVAAVAATVLANPTARGEQCPGMQGADPALASVDAAVRLDHIARTLDKAHRNAYLFNRVWGGIFAIGAVGSFSLAHFVEDEKFSTTQWVGGGKAVVASASTFVLPLRIRRVRKNDTRDTCAKLADAEAALRWSATRERKKKGVVEFASGLALNLTGFSILGFGYGYWTEAITSSLFGTTVGLIRMYTAPKTARRSLRRYKAGKIVAPTPAGVAWAVQPWAGRTGGGMSLTLAW